MAKIASGKVTGRRVGKNKDAAHSVLLLQAEITDPADIQTIELMSHAGEECNPPNGSKLTILSIGKAWRVAVGSDDRITPVAGVGEKRVYSTDSDGAAVVGQMHLHNDGQIEVKNNNASIDIAADGQITVTNPGATIAISAAGVVSITAAGQTQITSAQTVINNSVQVNGTITATGAISTSGASMANGVLTVSEANINGLNHSTHQHNETGTITEGPV